MIQEINNKDDVVTFLKSIHQDHLVDDIDHFSNEEQIEFINQIKSLNTNYPGGLTEYGQRARKLLKESSEDVNPFAEYAPSIPQGESLEYGTQQFIDFEEIGIKEIKNACFVLVAGGLGERLGYDGIKVGLPIELVTRRTFLEYYSQYILAFQQKHGDKDIPFAIMTSDDTHAMTVQLLVNNSYFGLKKDQVTLIKQEKVPAMIDNEARFARVPGKLLIETKPHGHGDIHTLLYMSGLAQKWDQENRKWIFIFQDTNPLAFRVLPAVLGVSATKGFELNSITVPRKPGEAVGAICQLTHQNGESRTLSVEYNQLDPLMKSIGGEPVDNQGFSKYPGNINCLIFSLKEYSKVLQESKGLIAEFINPKYADATKTKFKSSTRLECMMQDYPKLLQPHNKVGFTQIDRRFCFSACKNDLGTASQKSVQGLPTECAGSCEGDFYWLNAQILRLAGAQINQESQTLALKNGLHLHFGPKIVLHPSFGVTLSEIRQRIQHLQVSCNSTLVLSGDQILKNVIVDGILHISGNGTFEGTFADGKYNSFVELEGDVPGYLKIRGYRLI